MLGYTDPRLTTLETSSPTLTADGEALILQWLVNNRYTLEGGDLKTAFLSGDADESRSGDDAIYIEVPADIKSWLRLGPDEAMRLRKAVYGLINAPLRWHIRLSRALREAGFTPLQMDECVWVLFEKIEDKTKAKAPAADKLRRRMTGEHHASTYEPGLKRKIHRVLGGHVDDLLGGGNAKFQKAILWLRSELEFGAWGQMKFRFRGRELEQSPDKRFITVTMTQYVDSIEIAAVPKDARENPDQELSPALHSQYRGGVGQLQWLQMKGNPLLAYDAGVLNAYTQAPTGHNLLALNKSLRTAKVYRTIYYRVVGLPENSHGCCWPTPRGRTDRTARRRVAISCWQPTTACWKDSGCQSAWSRGAPGRSGEKFRARWVRRPKRSHQLWSTAT